jgi:hypothetical protein
MSSRRRRPLHEQTTRQTVENIPTGTFPHSIGRAIV